MTLVRERRHQQGLRLSLPPPLPAADFRQRTHYAALLSAIGPTSPDIESLSDLEKLSVIGHGNGGTVYKVRNRKSSSVYALKVLRFDQNAAIIRRQAACEAEILKRVDSQFVVKCHAVFDAIGGELCFVMEYMERGSLYDELSVRVNLPEDVISGVAQRVLRGLHYLHGMQIVHGDIKPSNLLINGKGDVKIADFGVSKIVVGTRNACDTCMGTCAYMSPERVDPERWNGCDADGFAGDVWSLGVVVLECFVGHYPLIGLGEKPDWAALMCAICFGERLEMPETASPEFRSFVRRCLEKEWRKRGTVDELLGHPFVNRSFGGSSNEGFIDFALHH
ncbi:PREDICTED: mitogen-activated protein kinase kinase 10 [Theobroma cacao]|uniref:mitogen-activated protein kinase kinase n=1 Tax=Theobroma cacao TaxID=3641 RepID=A0AB32W1L4_THECC|nr:PREDICTED: mitogen-activated protein kinase kinase 10 [Theobroma cacao]